MVIDLSSDEARAVVAALRYKADALRRLADDSRSVGEGKDALRLAAAELDRLVERFGDSSSPAP